MPGLIRHSLGGNAKGVGVADKEITVHVVSCRNSRGRIFCCLERVASVERDAPGMNDTYRIEHWAPVLVEEHLFSDGLSHDLQINSLSFERGSIGPVKETLDGRVFHESQFDILNIPIVHQGQVSLAQIL